MSAPTIVSYTSSGFSGGPGAVTSKAVSVPGTQPGDLLVVLGTTEDGPSNTFSGVSATGVTWTTNESSSTMNHSGVYGYSGLVTGSGALTVTLTLAASSNAMWGFGVFLLRNHGGVGNTEITVGTGAPSLALATTSANSVALMLSADWNALDGSGRTWRAGLVESDYFFSSGRYTVYVGKTADTGVVGTKTEGLTTPTGQQFTIVAVEVLAGAGGGSAPVANAGVDQTGIIPLSTVTLQGSGTNSPTSYAWTQTAGPAVTLSSSTAASPTFTAPANSNGATLTFSLVATNASGSSSPDTVNVVVLPHLEWGLNGAGVWRPSTTTLL